MYTWLHCQLHTNLAQFVENKIDIPITQYNGLSIQCIFLVHCSRSIDALQTTVIGILSWVAKNIESTKGNRNWKFVHSILSVLKNPVASKAETGYK